MQGLHCEKCGVGTMGAAKVFRLSGCLVAAGFTLVICSLLSFLLAALLLAAGPRGTREAVERHNAQAREKAAVAVRRIPDLPPAVVTDFEEDGVLEEEAIAGLPLEQRQRVRRVMVDYHGARAATGLAGATTGGIGVVAVIGLLGFALVACVGGLLLVLRKKVWRCSRCGYGVERV